MTKSYTQPPLLDKLIVDNFAGGGGASTGIELATGRPVDIAISHDPDAILMHRTNHPFTTHYCENVWDVKPAEVCSGRPMGLMWLSPDCKHFSRAKGGKPVDKNIRGLAWIALRWAATVKPRVIILENVPEFVTWGRLGKDGKPDPRYIGETFRSFVHQLRGKGYEVDWRKLKACDYGAPTIRERFFLIVRCDGKPIAYSRGRGWRTAIFDRKTICTANKITELADIGVSVTSETAKFLVKYFAKLEELNFDIIQETECVIYEIIRLST